MGRSLLSSSSVRAFGTVLGIGCLLHLVRVSPRNKSAAGASVARAMPGTRTTDTILLPVPLPQPRPIGEEVGLRERQDETIGTSPPLSDALATTTAPRLEALPQTVPASVQQRKRHRHPSVASADHKFFIYEDPEFNLHQVLDRRAGAGTGVAGTGLAEGTQLDERLACVKSFRKTEKHTADIALLELLEQHQRRTMDANEARYFVVPLIIWLVAQPPAIKERAALEETGDGGGGTATKTSCLRAQRRGCKAGGTAWGVCFAVCAVAARYVYRSVEVRI